MPPQQALSNHDHAHLVTGAPLELLRRTRIPYVLLFFALILAAIGEQLLEHQLSPNMGALGANELGKRAALPLLIAYMLLSLRFLNRHTLDALKDLRQAVRIDNRSFDRHVHRLTVRSEPMEWFLLAVSAIVVWALFVWLRQPLPIAGGVRVPNQLGWAMYVVITYTLFGWMGLALVVAAVRHAAALADLAQEPLDVNALDHTHVLPFGRLSLLHSVVLVGIVIILLATLGGPTRPLDFAVLTMVSLGGGVALIWPLWGVHVQMRAAKHQVLDFLCEQLEAVEQDLLACQVVDGNTLEEISKRVEHLTKLRQSVNRTPTWPFRNAGAIIRASAASVSPLIYFLLTAMLDRFLLPLLTGG